MQTIEEDDYAPRRSSIIKAEIRGFERNLSEAAERHDRFDYNQALNGLNAAKAELRDADLRERREATEAAQRAKFREETGYDDFGQMIADRFRNGHSLQASRVLNAERTQQIAERMLAPQPTDQDKAADALAKIREQTAAIKSGAQSALQQRAADTDFGDAA